MAKNKLAKGRITTSTQKYLDIAEIKEDTIVMRDGSLRAVLLVSSVNFALKSEEEQNGLVAGYVSFLNNLDFPAQIVIQSRALNIDSYIDRIKEQEKEQTNELLRIQTSEYLQYVSELVDMGRIMSKRFYVVVPYGPSSDKRKGFFASLLDAFKPAVIIRMKETRFQNYKKELNRRVERVVGGLSSMGINAALLDTQSAIELFYNTYNPTTSQNEIMVNTKDLRIVE